jgi:TPP-dependent 2-oxoacid decarboxylase
MVGSLSAINAIAGSYSEDLPVLLISGDFSDDDNDDGDDKELLISIS